MDIRQTFASTEELSEILTDLKATNADVAMLIDRDGLFRAAGKITDIRADDLKGGITVLLNEDSAYLLTDIVAVNGIFRSDYSEC